MQSYLQPKPDRSNIDRWPSPTNFTSWSDSEEEEEKPTTDRESGPQLTSDISLEISFDNLLSDNEPTIRQRELAVTKRENEVSEREHRIAESEWQVTLRERRLKARERKLIEREQNGCNCGDFTEGSQVDNEQSGNKNEACEETRENTPPVIEEAVGLSQPRPSLIAGYDKEIIKMLEETIQQQQSTIERIKSENAILVQHLGSVEKGNSAVTMF